MKFPQISKTHLPLVAAAFAALIGLGAATEASAQHRTARAAAAQTATTPASSEGVVNVNTATDDELMRLPGIGRATLRRLRPLMALSGATTYVERTRSSARRASGEGEPEGGDTSDDAGE